MFTDENERLQLDVEHLVHESDQKDDQIAKLENKLEILDRESRKHRMRIFGLKEEKSENERILKKRVLEDVLKIACPDEDWHRDENKYAFRIGSKAEKQDGMVIIDLRFDEDKHKIYSGRESLREIGISVGKDLPRNNVNS